MAIPARMSIKPRRVGHTRSGGALDQRGDDKTPQILACMNKRKSNLLNVSTIRRILLTDRKSERPPSDANSNPTITHISN